MDRIDRTGIGIAAAGHVALFAALSLGLFAAKNKLPLRADPIEVSFVENVGRTSAAPAPASEPAAPSVAPEIAAPQEPAPAPAAAAPAAPAPAPPSPKAAPEPAPIPKPIKPTPLPDLRDRRRPDRLEGAMSGIAAASKAERKATGARLGSDFLKGITAEKSEGKATAPRAAAVSAQAMASLGAALFRQFKPCYDLGALGGTSAMSIQTVLRLRFRPDGTIAVAPATVEQNGVTGANAGYARQIEEAAKRAVQRCSPIRLPPSLYDGGWDDFELNFVPGQMG